MLVPQVSSITFPQLESQMMTITTDKESYYLGDKIIISGTSEDYQEEITANLRVLKMSGEGSGGTRTNIIFDANGEFSIIISNTDNFESGRYVVQLTHYHKDENKQKTHTVETDIKYGLNDIKTISDDLYSQKIIFSIDKKFYNAGDKIIVSGKAPKEYVWNYFSFNIIDSKNKFVTRNSTIIDSDGNYKAIINTDDFKLNGNYKIELYIPYTKETFVANFQYDDSEIIDVVKLHEQVQDVDSEVKELRTDVNSLQVQLDNLTDFVNDQITLILNMFAGLSNNNSTNTS